MRMKKGCDSGFRAVLAMGVVFTMVKAEAGFKKELLSRQGAQNPHLSFVAPQASGASRYARRSHSRSSVPFRNAKTLEDTRGLISTCGGVRRLSYAKNGRSCLVLLRRDRGSSGQEQIRRGYVGSRVARRGLSFHIPDRCFTPEMAVTCDQPSDIQGLPSELDDNLFLAGGGAVTKERGEEGEECAGGQGGRGRIRVEGVGRGGRMRRRRGAGSAREAAHKGRRRKGRNGGQGGVETGERESPWAMYQRFMSERPLLTKSITAAIISSLGQLLASAIKASNTSPSYPPAPPPITPPSASAYFSARASALAVKAGIGMGAGLRAGVGAELGLAGGSPGLLRRVAAFAIFGLFVKGPVFHWWYRALDRHAARRRKAGEAPGGPRDIAFKLAMDRFVLTPPYLAINLVGLSLLQGFGVERSITDTKAVYVGALLTNWKVCTLTQLFNFKVVPLEYCPIFGNLVACWWSMYLSLLSDKK